MTRNIGPADRALRLLLGAALILMALASGWPAFQGGLPRALAVIAGVVLMLFLGLITSWWALLALPVVVLTGSGLKSADKMASLIPA